MKTTSTAIIAFLAAIGISACGGTSMSLPPEPPKYVITDVKKQEPSRNSLWSPTESIFSDRRAKGINDLVTIRILESATARKKAGTKTDRSSSMDAGIDTLFGLLSSDHPLTTGVKASATNDFNGAGETTREGALQANITARVVEVMPNGNFIVESRKEITVNREKQILVLQGQIRPEDIESSNSIQSTYVADAKIYYTGNGIIDDKQGQGWFVRVMDKVWPF